MAIAVANYGWPAGYHTRGGIDFNAYLLAKLNDKKQCAEIFNRCKLEANTYCINVHDAFYSLTSRGKI